MVREERVGQLGNEAYEKVIEVRAKSKCERLGARGIELEQAAPQNEMNTMVLRCDLQHLLSQRQSLLRQSLLQIEESDLQARGDV